MNQAIMSNQSKLGPKFIGDIAGTFFVPNYQRGYRWDPDDVTRLLDDIWKSNGRLYRLQPLVVKLRKESDDEGICEWELIDGQQRLTTLYLVFLYMRHSGLQSLESPYNIHYETRLGSEKYLRYLDKNIHERNIDYYYLYKAYECIEKWFDSHGKKRQYVANDFYGFLFKSVQIIWYEAPLDVDSTALFTRLNMGRIPLTDAELVKALLLSSVRISQPDRAQELAAQWDGIERDLRNPDVWAFVTDVDTENDAEKYPTRISLLLDTLAPLPKGHPPERKRPRYYTFEKLRERIESNPIDFWNEVLGRHALILGWFSDRVLYHRIGYLVATGTPFADLVALSSNQKKDDFKEILRNRIIETLKVRESDIDNLSYGKKSDHKKLLNILLLMNVETISKINDETQRFCFRFHHGKKWSLEHIHAQNTESLTRAEQWKAWLEAHKDILDVFPEQKALIDDIKKALCEIDTVKNFGTIFQQLSSCVVNVTSAPVSSSTKKSNFDMNSIRNLALLDKDVNSSLGNEVFESKRRKIIKADRQGMYIPVCTRNIFLKYYTDADAQQIHFWSPQDRESYYKAIISTLNEYLTPEAAAEEKDQ